jgi:hypothetical protein
MLNEHTNGIETNIDVTSTYKRTETNIDVAPTHKRIEANIDFTPTYKQNRDKY